MLTPSKPRTPSEAEPEAPVEAARRNRSRTRRAAATDAAETDEADLVEVEPEPLATDAEAPVEAAEEELVEVEPEPEAATPEPAAPAAAEHERLFDLEPIEAPTPAAEEEEVSLEPVDHLASTPGAEEADIVEAFEATQVAPAPPIEEAELPSVEAVDHIETVEQFEKVEDADALALDALGLEPAPLEDLLPAETVAEEIAPLEPPALVSGEGEDTLGESQLDLEPVEPIADLQPITEAARAAPADAPQQPQQPPPGRSGGLDSFSWGANQEHFFGGMPLRLTPPSGVPKVPLTPAIPMAPAAVAPLIQPPIAPPPPAVPTAPTASASASLGEDDLDLEPIETIAEETPPSLAPQPAPPTPQPVAPQAAPQIRRPIIAPRAPQQPPAQKGKGIKGSPIATGFDGLAMPPVRETDVFAQNPGSLTAGFAPGLMNDVFAGGSRIGPPTIPPTQPPQAASAPADAARPRRASKAEPQGDAWAAPTKEPRQRAASPSASGSHSSLPPVQPPQPPPPRKKRRWFGLKMLLLFIMPIFMAAAVVGVFIAMPVQSAVTGTLHFTNIENLTEGQRKDLEKEQTDIAYKDSIRVLAADKLRTANQPISFLGDKDGYPLLASTARSSTNKAISLLLTPAARSARSSGRRHRILIANRCSPSSRRSTRRTARASS